MPTTINASNTTGGAVVTGDGSGILELQSGGVTGLTVNGANVTVAGTLTATGGIPANTLTGTLGAANGGTGLSSPGSAGNVLTSNGTGWVSSAIGVYTEFLNRSTDVTLTAANVGKVVVDPTVSIMIQLPNATTLTEGKTFEITNISEQNNMFVRSSDGTYQAFVAAGETVNITAESVSTAAGVWVADNPNYGFSSPVSFGFTSSAVSQVNAQNSVTAAISATKMIRIIYGSSSTNGVTATIITKSGANITKGAPQYIFNFTQNSARIGVINVVMTSATTGIITTFNGSSGGAVGAINLYTFSLDGNDNIQITGGTSIDANSSVSNANSIAITTLSSTYAVVMYHASGFLYSRVLTLSGGLITAVGNITSVPWAGGAASSVTQFPQLIALSSTKVVAAYVNSPGLEVGIVVGDLSGTQINWGTEVSPFTTGSNGFQFSLCRLSATEFIFAMTDNSVIRAYYGSVSGTTITLGAQNSHTPSGSTLYSCATYPISSTAAVVVWYDTNASFNKPYAAVYTKSGTSLVKGTTYTIANNPTPLSTSPAPFSLKGFVAFDPIQQPSTDLYMDYTSTNYVFAVPMSVSGTVITPGTGLLVTEENVQVSSGFPAICTLSKTRALAFVPFNMMSDGTVGSRLYLIDTSGARPVVLNTSTTIGTASIFCATPLSPTRALIAYSTSPNLAGTIRTLDITGDTFTFNTSITSASLIGVRPALCRISSTKAMMYVSNSSTDHRIYNIAISGTTLTESPSYVSTSDAAAQSSTSRRILFNLGTIGYFYSVQSGTLGYIQQFNVSGTSPTNLSSGTNTVSANNQILYSALLGPGTYVGMGSTGGSGSLGSISYSGPDANIRTIGSVSADNFNATGITLPFNQNSVMVIGNNMGYFGKATVTPSTATFSENPTILGPTKSFAPSLSMHCNIQDWVESDNFVPNSDKILFFGRNASNLRMELYHVFDKGAAQ
jgi:hypothetical protein